jgi:hypothetical protein
MSDDTEYQGWKNRATWNVALYINNEYPLYQAAVAYVKKAKAAGRRPTYGAFIKSAGLEYDKTPDGFAYAGTRLDYTALTEMLDEMVPDEPHSKHRRQG